MNFINTTTAAILIQEIDGAKIFFLDIDGHF